MSLSGRHNARIKPASKQVKVIYFDSLHYGKDVQIVRIRRRADPPMVIVRLPEGIQVQMPLEHTDYSSQPRHNLEGKYLLSIEGMRKAVKIVEEINARHSYPVEEQESSD
jgi:hypothetical protein